MFYVKDRGNKKDLSNSPDNRVRGPLGPGLGHSSSASVSEFMGELEDSETLRVDSVSEEEYCVCVRNQSLIY